MYFLWQAKYRDRVLGLILVSPLCKPPTWTEWFYNKVASNLLYYYGMCGLVKEGLLQRYFSKEVRGCSDLPESDIVQACRSVSITFFSFLDCLLSCSLDILDVNSLCTHFPVARSTAEHECVALRTDNEHEI
jgi:hypothetical protein